MLGTGLFAAISSIIVGFNMISDAGTWSLLTMVNIFTLFVIIIMAWQTVSSKNAIIKKDDVAMAYNNIKLRTLFWVLVVSTILVFIGFPLLSLII